MPMLRFLLILLIACLLPQNAAAYTTCSWVPEGTTTVPGGTNTTPGYWFCQITEDGIGSELPTDPHGGGGGGGGSSEGVWVQVNGADYTAEVNVVKNQVRTNDVSCSDETVSRQVVAGRILVKNPNLLASTVVTVFFSDGQQTFQRVNGSGTFQMVPTSGCV